ncbi:unnamed protein product [Sphenostylis stenocarpa]|uniref:Uncharacterized protein n=1 Tax=Sphenostylis stenocarpa TaxID=92480 RepID=A0AA86RV85_9FABA|nr:unnamed protein product [Sphenostylis stenocarpa]
MYLSYVEGVCLVEFPLNLFVLARVPIIENQRTRDMGSKSELAIDKLFSDLQINEFMPDFDVYLPNSRFTKSSPGDPKEFTLADTLLHCMAVCDRVGGLGHPPSKVEIESLEKQCGGIPLKICQLIGFGDVRERCRMGSVTHNQYLALAKLIMILMWEHVIVDHSKNMKALA